MKLKFLCLILSIVASSTQAMTRQARRFLPTTAHALRPSINPGICVANHRAINIYHPSPAKTQKPLTPVWCSQNWCNTPNWCKYANCIIFGRKITLEDSHHLKARSNCLQPTCRVNEDTPHQIINT